MRRGKRPRKDRIILCVDKYRPVCNRPVSTYYALACFACGLKTRGRQRTLYKLFDFNEAALVEQAADSLTRSLFSSGVLSLNILLITRKNFCVLLPELFQFAHYDTSILKI